MTQQVRASGQSEPVVDGLAQPGLDLDRAYEMGRAAMEQGVSLLDVVAAHQESAARIMEEGVSFDETREGLSTTFAVLREVLAPYDMAYRAFREMNEGLVEANRRLQDATGELDAARAEAEAANHAKSEFLSKMSHELRTPLNSIIGFGQILELDELSEEQDENVKLILKAGHHLLALINEVLDISRIEVDRLSLSLEAVSLTGQIWETIRLVEHMAADRDITVDVGAVPEGVHVMADYQRLRQVLLNLLTNAIKYNREGGKVTVETEVRSGRLEIAVTDTGPGLSKTRLGRLFTPFDRLGAENGATEGTGLGLVLARRLSEAMGGALRVSSEVGVGSTFTLELSVADPDSYSPAHDLRFVEVTEDAATAGTILYVEDNHANVVLVERIVAFRPNVKLITAGQGGLGLELAMSAKPDLILLDLNLPDISGDKVLKALALEESTGHIPVAILSADATRRQIRRLKEEGAVEYLTKPIDVKEVLEVIDDYLSTGGTP